MENGQGVGRHGAKDGGRKRVVKRRASTVAAIAASLAFVAMAAALWHLSPLERNIGTAGSSPLVLGRNLAVILSSSDVVAPIAAAVSNALGEQPEGDSLSDENDAARKMADISPDNLDAVPSESGLASFALFGNAPDIAETEVAAVQDAIAATEGLGSVGLVFFDATTGKGLAYNADEAVYGASSFKGPYSVYVCQALVENGTIDLDSPVDVASSNPGSIAIDPLSSWATSGASSFSTGELIAAAITASDNDAYGMLRNQYDIQGYDAWIEGVGVGDAPRDPLSWYPTYCARSSAKLWTNALAYLESGSDTALWLAGLFQQTYVSFIRDGIESTEGGAGALVLDKAGWIADTDPAYNAVCDAGIIKADGAIYIMCIMTSQSDCLEARSNVSALAAALFEARGLLA